MTQKTSCWSWILHKLFCRKNFWHLTAVFLGDAVGTVDAKLEKRCCQCGYTCPITPDEWNRWLNE